MLIRTLRKKESLWQQVKTELSKSTNWWVFTKMLERRCVVYETDLSFCT